MGLKIFSFKKIFWLCAGIELELLIRSLMSVFDRADVNLRVRGGEEWGRAVEGADMS